MPLTASGSTAAAGDAWARPFVSPRRASSRERDGRWECLYATRALPGAVLSSWAPGPGAAAVLLAPPRLRPSRLLAPVAADQGRADAAADSLRDPARSDWSGGWYRRWRPSKEWISPCARGPGAEGAQHGWRISVWGMTIHRENGVKVFVDGNRDPLPNAPGMTVSGRSSLVAARPRLFGHGSHASVPASDE